MPALEKVENADDGNLLLQLYENYNKLVYSLAFIRLKNHDLAEECVQETFLTVVKKIDMFKGLDEGHRKNLICTIARGKAVDSIRKENIFEFVPEPEELDISYFDPFQSIDLSDQIEKLSETEQTYIYLKFCYGFSNVEIAKTFKKSASYIGRVVNGSLLKIKKELEEKI